MKGIAQHRPYLGQHSSLLSLVLTHVFSLKLRKVQHGTGTVDIVPNYVICPSLNSFNTDFLQSLVTTWLRITSFTLQVSLLAICLWVTSCFSYFPRFSCSCQPFLVSQGLMVPPVSLYIPDTSGVRTR